MNGNGDISTDNDVTMVETNRRGHATRFAQDAASRGLLDLMLLHVAFERGLAAELIEPARERVAAGPAEREAGPHQHRVTDFFGDPPGLRESRCRAVARGRQSRGIQHVPESAAVLGQVDRQLRHSQDRVVDPDQPVFEAAARTLGYLGPDPKARVMRAGKFNAIGVVFWYLTDANKPLAED